MPALAMLDGGRTYTPRRNKSRCLSVKVILAAILCLGLLAESCAAPSNFSEAKRLLRQHVYMDQNQSPAGDLYCGCKWRWLGKSGGEVDLDSCGLNATSHINRLTRIEYEHLVPASLAGQHRQCWRQGGRANCQKTDPAFNRMEADMHNLTVVSGGVNAFRSNLPYGMVVGPSVNLGSCTTKIGLLSKSIEPRNEAKGMAARATFYMADRYVIRLSDSQQRTLMAWDKTYPPSPWERERSRRIAYSMGHENDFVTGAQTWTLGYRPRGQGNILDAQSPAKPLT